MGTFDFAYDDPSGVYTSLSATAVANGGIEPLRVEAGLGYAARLASGLTFDVGGVRSHYSHYSSQGHSNSYTELYVGIGRQAISSRLSFSPHYFNYGTWTVYGEVEGNIGLARKLQLNGHVGLLVPVRTSSNMAKYKDQYDWSVGLARELGRASAHVALSGGGPGRDHYREYHHSRTSLVLSLGYAL